VPIRSLSVLLAALTLVACSGGDDTPDAATSTTTAPGTTTSTAPPIEVKARLGTTRIVGAGVPHASPPPMDKVNARDLLEAVDGYVQAAFVAPLREHERADLDGLLGLGATARLAEGEHDRRVLTTEGLPRVRAARLKLARIDLAALTEGFGSFPLVSASISFSGELDTVDGRVSIRHLGELVLAKDGGTWQVVGYEMAVVRDDGTNTTTTTASSAP
jgi:hypothetical protein